jgi:hypothetical protein
VKSGTNSIKVLVDSESIIPKSDENTNEKPVSVAVTKLKTTIKVIIQVFCAALVTIA